MMQPNYTWSFGGALFVLTLAALASFREISASSVSDRDDVRKRWLDDTGAPATPAPKPSYEALHAADAEWRQANARPYSLTELRVRGDGRRTPRQSMQDRVYAASRRGDRGAAIVELERWVRANPRDADALLWLARLLNESGRTKESVKRYRQALALVR